jgi:sugar diacid utilization regulator/GAF domain-containing protein
MECDLRAVARAAESKRPAIFECWNGLYDCAIPIAPKGEVVGYFLCGQILTGPPQADRVAQTAEGIGVDPDAYVEALREVRVVPSDQYESSIRTMHALAQMIADQAAAAIDNLKMLQDALSAKEDAAKLVDELNVILEAFRESLAQPDDRSTLETIADQLGRLVSYDSCLIYTIDDGGDELVPRVVRDPNPEPFRSFRPRKGVGVWGKVAATGVRRKIDDVRHDPDFVPVVGVDVEPEAMLVVPMIRQSTIFGVISLSRLKRRVFTEHELRILAAFSSQASLSIQVAQMQRQSARRLGEEQALGELLGSMAQGLSVDETLTAIAQGGLDVLGAHAAVVRIQPEPGAPDGLVRLAIGESDARELLSALETETEGCMARLASRVLERRDSSLLLVPLHAGGEALGIALFIVPPGAQPDQRVIDAFARQSSLGLRNALARERERRVLLQHRLLSALGPELAESSSREQVWERLLGRASEIFGAELSLVALLDDSPDAIRLRVREGRRTRELSISLAGRGRFASARLGGETAPEGSVFGAWAQEVFDQLAVRVGTVSYMAAPLSSAGGVLGGLFVAWRTRIDRFSDEQRRLLGLVAGAAGASVGNLIARAETDHSLRRRLTELQALTQLAAQITELTEEGPILDELLAAFQQLAGIKGAVYAVRGEGGWAARQAAGLEPAEIADVTATLGEEMPGARPAPEDHDADARRLLTVAIPGPGRDALIAGVSPRPRDAQRDSVLAALGRYGSVALENASLHSRQRRAIARLEDANEKLRRVLSVHETLTADVVGGHGLQSVADSLAGLVGAEVLVQAPPDAVLARSPAGSDLEWSPPRNGSAARTTDEAPGTGHVVASPAAVRDETLAWVVARFDGAPGQVERAALEHGALLVALELLRERTAIEVETRLRGGFLEELFSGEFVEDLIVKQGAAFGFDLRSPTRIFLVELAEGELDGANGHLLYAVANACAARWPGGHLVALENSAVVALVEERREDNGSGADSALFEDQLRSALDRGMSDVRLNIGVSRLVCTVPEYKRAYAVTRRGLDLARLLGRSGELVSFRHLGVQEILLQAGEPTAVLEFIARFVDPLDRYDAEHSSKLLHSLETFYQAGLNLQAAARRLDVHVSTLRYRLRRIEELLGVDPKAGDSRLNIEVALKAAKALAAYRD